MSAEFGHEITQKRRHRFVDHLAVSDKDLRGVSDVGLRRCHLTGIAEAEDAAQLC
jgi:hypothetical protein